MQHVERLPRNWTQAGTGWRWTPPKEEQRPSQIRVQAQDAPADPAAATARMLRTRPSFVRWRDYWTDGGNLDCGGWNLRAVQGFHLEDEG